MVCSMSGKTAGETFLDAYAPDCVKKFFAKYSAYFPLENLQYTA